MDAGGTPRVWTVGASGGDPRPFEKTKASIELAWAPGSRIIYQSPGNRNFHVLDPRTEEETPLIRDDSIGWTFSPHPSPDGTAVAVKWNRIGVEEDGVWVISLEDSSERFLQPGRVRPIGWSADSSQVFTSDGAGRIWRVSRGGGTPDLMWSLSLSNIGGAHITPDGRSLVVTLTEAQSDLWLVDGLRGAVGERR
jgi:Tol biopolymer transport system component